MTAFFRRIMCLFGVHGWRHWTRRDTIDRTRLIAQRQCEDCGRRERFVNDQYMPWTRDR